MTQITCDRFGSFGCVITSEHNYTQVANILKARQSQITNLFCYTYENKVWDIEEALAHISNLITLCENQAKNQTYALKIWYQANNEDDFFSELYSTRKIAAIGGDTGVINLRDDLDLKVDSLAFTVALSAPLQIHVNGKVHTVSELNAMFFKKCANDLLNAGIPDYLKFRESIFKQLKILQDQHYIHGDIKPANILMCDGTYRFADFGMTTTDREYKERLYAVPKILPQFPPRTKGTSLPQIKQLPPMQQQPMVGTVNIPIDKADPSKHLYVNLTGTPFFTHMLLSVTQATLLPLKIHSHNNILLQPSKM